MKEFIGRLLPKFTAYYSTSLFTLILSATAFHWMVKSGTDYWLSLLVSQVLWGLVSYPLLKHALRARSQARHSFVRWSASWLMSSLVSQGVLPVFAEIFSVPWLLYVILAGSVSALFFLINAYWVFVPAKRRGRKGRPGILQ